MSSLHRTYFLAVGIFAAWVGAWGYFVPTLVGRALPWIVPPLHARFIAGTYIAGGIAMFAGLVARRADSVRIPLALATLWTGLLFIVSLLHLDAFDFAKPQVWFWFGAYLVYPLWGAWLYTRGPRGEPAVRADIVLLLIALACALTGLGLLFAPVAMTRAWPWALPPLLAHIYAAPFIAYAACAVMLAREANPAARRIVLASLLAFAVLALVASAMHAKLFHSESPAAWVWFGGFGLSAPLLAWRLAAAWQSPRGIPTAST